MNKYLEFKRGKDKKKRKTRKTGLFQRAKNQVGSRAVGREVRKESYKAMRSQGLGKRTSKEESKKLGNESRKINLNYRETR